MVLMEESEPQHNPLLTNTMRPLDVRDLAANWPIWRQQFKIYLLAIHDQVSEHRKLAIFLNCLGPSGIALATKYFPQLKEFDSVTAKELSFQQLWSLFDDLSAKAKPRKDAFGATFDFYEMIKYWEFDGDFTKSYQELCYEASKCGFQCNVCETSYRERMVRDQLMRILPEHEFFVIRDLLKLKDPDSQALISKYNDIQKDRKIWAQIFPYLTLCDMEAVSLSSPEMESIVHWFIETLGQVQIKQCCLDIYCPESSPEFYEKHGAVVRNLKLNNIPESDIRMMIYLFKSVEIFALQDVQILDSESIEGFPNQLVALTLTNTTMELHLMKQWLSESYGTLDTLEMENFVYSFYASSNSDRIQPLHMFPFYNLKTLIIKADEINVIITESDIPCKLEVLKLSARKSHSTGFNCPNLRQLHYDVDRSNPLLFLRFKASLSTLVSLTTHWSPYETFSDFKALEELKITTPVPLRLKPDIESLPIKSIIVEYEPMPEIPEEPNLIFDILNEYCILEIMDYLSVTDWMIFAQLHPIAEQAAISYKYPRQSLKTEDCSDAKMLLNMEHFECISGSVKTFSISLYHEGELQQYFNILRMMTSLKSLYLSCSLPEVVEILPEVVEMLPEGLEKFELESYNPGVDLTPYFKRLSPTLKILKFFHCGNNDQCLAELENLRELDISQPQLSIPVLAYTLQRNADTLEKLKVSLNGNPESGWVLYEEVLQAIGSLRNLKSLKLRRSLNPDIPSVELEGGCHLLTDMFKKIGRQLKSLSIDIYSEEVLEILDIVELKNISEIYIEISPPVRAEDAFALLSTLKNLRKVGLRLSSRYQQSLNLKIPELMSLLEALPHLTHLEPSAYVTTIKFRRDLQEYLKQKKRELWINNVKI